MNNIKFVSNENNSFDLPEYDYENDRPEQILKSANLNFDFKKYLEEVNKLKPTKTYSYFKNESFLISKINQDADSIGKNSSQKNIENDFKRDSSRIDSLIESLSFYSEINFDRQSLILDKRISSADLSEKLNKSKQSDKDSMIDTLGLSTTISLDQQCIDEENIDKANRKSMLFPETNSLIKINEDNTKENVELRANKSTQHQINSKNEDLSNYSERINTSQRVDSSINKNSDDASKTNSYLDNLVSNTIVSLDQQILVEENTNLVPEIKNSTSDNIEINKKQESILESMSLNKVVSMEQPIIVDENRNSQFFPKVENLNQNQLTTNDLNKQTEDSEVERRLNVRDSFIDDPFNCNTNQTVAIPIEKNDHQNRVSIITLPMKNDENPYLNSILNNIDSLLNDLETKPISPDIYKNLTPVNVDFIENNSTGNISNNNVIKVEILPFNTDSNEHNCHDSDDSEHHLVHSRVQDPYKPIKVYNCYNRQVSNKLKLYLHQLSSELEKPYVRKKYSRRKSIRKSNRNKKNLTEFMPSKGIQNISDLEAYLFSKENYFEFLDNEEQIGSGKNQIEKTDSSSSGSLKFTNTIIERMSTDEEEVFISSKNKKIAPKLPDIKPVQNDPNKNIIEHPTKTKKQAPKIPILMPIITPTVKDEQQNKLKFIEEAKILLSNRNSLSSLNDENKQKNLEENSKKIFVNLDQNSNESFLKNSLPNDVDTAYRASRVSDNYKMLDNVLSSIKNKEALESFRSLEKTSETPEKVSDEQMKRFSILSNLQKQRNSVETDLATSLNTILHEKNDSIVKKLKPIAPKIENLATIEEDKQTLQTNILVKKSSITKNEESDDDSFIEHKLINIDIYPQKRTEPSTEYESLSTSNESIKIEQLKTEKKIDRPETVIFRKKSLSPPKEGMQSFVTDLFKSKKKEGSSSSEADTNNKRKSSIKTKEKLMHIVKSNFKRSSSEKDSDKAEDKSDKKVVLRKKNDNSNENLHKIESTIIEANQFVYRETLINSTDTIVDETDKIESISDNTTKLPPKNNIKSQLTKKVSLESKDSGEYAIPTNLPVKPIRSSSEMNSEKSQYYSVDEELTSSDETISDKDITVTKSRRNSFLLDKILINENSISSNTQLKFEDLMFHNEKNDSVNEKLMRDAEYFIQNVREKKKEIQEQDKQMNQSSQKRKENSQSLPNMIEPISQSKKIVSKLEKKKNFLRKISPIKLDNSKNPK